MKFKKSTYKATRKISLIILIIITLTGATLYAGQKPLSVFVSIPPQAYFVEQLARERASVAILADKGENPESYAPKPHAIIKLKKADIFFTIGVPFEKRLLEKIKNSFKNINIVNTAKGIKLRKMEGGTEDDPHTWLSPALVKHQAKIITNALCNADKAGEKIYKENLKRFINKLNKLNIKIKTALKPIAGGTIFVFHPAFGYFTDQYQLKQKAIQISGKTPKAAAVSSFIKQAKAQNIRIIFLQPQFDKQAASKIAKAINGAVVFLDPLGKNYIKNLEDIADKILAALKP
ncbi:MAG: zinc ABC transporter substrate-binding protein [Deltaproteobacteria bacterium]|nr:zinc ABC transporter substrate-binding protein [Deltaproteobacteria bacterium]